MTLQIPQNDLKILQNYLPMREYQYTWIFRQFTRLPHKVIALFTGNQAMKTSAITFSYVLRIHNFLPVPEKNFFWFECPQGCKWITANKPKDNICPKHNEEIAIKIANSRIIRFASEILPNEKGVTADIGGQSKEISNTVYPEFKRWLPRNLIKDDITHRNPSMSIIDPNSGSRWGDLYYPGGEIVVEFVSYGQTVQRQAGVQRKSIYMDEEPPYEFYEEQFPRTLKTGGDILIGLTPANRISYMHDEVFSRAKLYVRTQTIIDFYASQGDSVQQVEFTDSKSDIAVIQAATDDNPTVDADEIERTYAALPDADPDSLAIRRYGVFKQSTGRIFKDFSYKIHMIDPEKWFPEGRIFHEWRHGMLIDYHPHNKWAVLFVSLSPQNEFFIWWEWTPDPERLITYQIAMNTAEEAQDYRWHIALIDPLANVNQNKEGITTVEDLNQQFLRFFREGYCTNVYWEVWDTKGTEGRNRLKVRLKNALDCERPFNNLVKDEHGLKRWLPTVWIFNSCKQCAASLKHWKLQEHSSKNMAVTMDRKEVPEQKWSHFCTALEGILKDPRWVPPRSRDRSFFEKPRAWSRRHMRPKRRYA